MKLATFILMTLAILTVSTSLYADHEYQVGYQSGYRDGLRDKQTRVDFNYQNSYRTCECISNNSYTETQFREGYKDGYVEGYSQRVYVVSNNGNRVYTNYGNRVYTNNGSRVYTSYGDPAYRSEGFVMAYQDDKFKGDLAYFPVGRYPDLDRMNWQDKVESIQVPANVRVILFEDENFKGQSLILEGSSSDLDELNFEERAESMIVEFRY